MNITPNFLDGVVLAVNAIENAVVIIDQPRCEALRASRIGQMHDRFGTLVGSGAEKKDRRHFTLNYRFGQDVTGVEDEIIRTIETIAERMPNCPIFLVQGVLSLIVNTDIMGIAKMMREKVENPVLPVTFDGIEGDWIDGMRAVHQAIKAYAPLKAEREKAKQKAKSASFYGFTAFRNEADEAANVAEIKRLFQGLGIGIHQMPGALSPLSFDDDDKDGESFFFPYAWDEATPPKKRLPLPIGMEATEAMLNRVSEAFGRKKQAIALIEKERAAIEGAIRRFAFGEHQAKGAVIVGDPFFAYPLMQAVRSLSIATPLVVLLAKEEHLARSQFKMQDERTDPVETLVHPTWDEAWRVVESFAKRGEVDIVIGSGLLRDMAFQEALAYVELGFPAFLEHFHTPTPYMGYQGISHLVWRIDNALNYRDYALRRRNAKD